jgi:hypothetical protein
MRIKGLFIIFLRSPLQRSFRMERAPLWSLR